MQANDDDRELADDLFLQGIFTHTQLANALASHRAQATAELVGVLGAMTERYVELVNCGDCGHWNPETEQEVIDARALLRKHGGE
ncbi:MAG: hypothetical protein ABW128_15560 [Rhizorhabdus sp.]